MKDVTALWLVAAPMLSRQPEEEQKGGMVTQKAGGGDWWGCGRAESQELVRMEMEAVRPHPASPRQEPVPASKEP